MIRGLQFLYIFIVLSVCFAGPVSGQVHPESRQHKLLLISFDGFRNDYLTKTDTPNFDSFVKEGVKAEGLIPVFPTKTFPNHYSIATGLYPEHTGIVANTMYDPVWEKWYRPGDREAVENGEWYEGEPIWITADKQGLTTGTMFWVGSEADIQGMRPTYWKRYDGSMPERARIDTVVSWLARGRNPADLATLYFELADDAGHGYGLKSDSLIAAIRKSDELIGYLRQKLVKAGLWNSTNIIIVSDHGMIDLSADKIIVLDSIIDMNSVEWMVWDPVTMIQPKQGELESMYRKLKQREDHYKIYKKKDLPERYHLKNHRRVPELIMIADLGYTIADRENKARFLRGLPGATHGFDNTLKEMWAFFAARGPAFASGDTAGSFQNIHIYELMCHIAGIKPAPNDGSLDSVRILLRNNDEW